MPPGPCAKLKWQRTSVTLRPVSLCFGRGRGELDARLMFKLGEGIVECVSLPMGACAGVLISISAPAPGAPSTLGRAARFTAAAGCFLSRPNTLLVLSASPGDGRSWQSLCSFSISGRWGPALVPASPLPPTDSLSLWIRSPVSLSPGEATRMKAGKGRHCPREGALVLPASHFLYDLGQLL